MVHDTSVGIHLSLSARTVLEDIRVTGTTGPGIVLSGGTDPLLRRCRTARTKGPGLLVSDRARGTFEDCRLDSAEDAALHVRGSASPVLIGLTVRDCARTGVLLEEESVAEAGPPRSARRGQHGRPDNAAAPTRWCAGPGSAAPRSRTQGCSPLGTCASRISVRRSPVRRAPVTVEDSIEVHGIGAVAVGDGDVSPP
ncbi:right-handed parallel beta-helix repeat-containing protein [Streptomyces sp. NBC_00057]|uniref:right-handed parallel beta-helix repeat-containing protein n=1 Tax=Streptomyces sp. NBC_00057 TaxID=2975634 RepID=UPI00386BE534